MQMLDANRREQKGCMRLDRLNVAAQGVSMVAHGVHVAAQKLLLCVLGAA